MLVFGTTLEKRKILYVRLVAMMIPVAIFLTLLTQTVSAKNVFVINDGDLQRVHTTYATDPAQVLTEAGFSLEADDLYTTAAVDGVSEITVQRAQQITVDFCGETLTVCSYGETVQNLLDRIEIPYEGQYQLSGALSDETFDGMALTVANTIQNVESFTEEIPFETVVCYADNLEKGREVTVSAGVCGQVKKTARVVYVNGLEQERNVFQETVLKAPEEEIIVCGTGKNVTGRTADGPYIGDGVLVTADGQILRFDRTAQFKATAYTHTDEGCNMITATGSTVRTGVVAVDPRVIPYGTRMYIVANDGSYVYGVSAAEDCGGGIKGNRLDLYFETTQECMSFGVRNCTVYFLTD